MIKFSNCNLQTATGTFNGHIEIDASDGDVDSLALLQEIKRLFDKAAEHAVRWPAPDLPAKTVGPRKRKAAQPSPK